MSAWQCLRLYSNQLSSLMLACTSIDRLFAVIVPLWYFNQGTKYSKRMVGSFYLGALLSCSALVFVSYTKRHTHFYPSICRGSHIVGGGAAAQYNYSVRLIGASVSVVLYLVIPFLYKQSQTSSNDQEEQQHKERQKRLMHTLGISAVFTLLFVIVPNLYKTVFVGLLGDDWRNGVFDAIPAAATTLGMCNPVINYFLYTMRHKDIRDAVIKLFKKKNRVVPVKPRL